MQEEIRGVRIKCLVGVAVEMCHLVVCFAFVRIVCLMSIWLYQG